MHKGRSPTTVVLSFIICYSPVTIYLILLFVDLLLNNKAFQQPWIKKKNQKHMFSEKLNTELWFLGKIDPDW